MTTEEIQDWAIGAVILSILVGLFSILVFWSHESETARVGGDSPTKAQVYSKMLER